MVHSYKLYNFYKRAFLKILIHLFFRAYGIQTLLLIESSVLCMMYFSLCYCSLEMSANVTWEGCSSTHIGFCQKLIQ
jgi:hypothetical protein